MKREFLIVQRYFVEVGQKPESLFDWKKVDCEIRDSKGDVLFQMKKVEAPKEWSQLAIDIAASKYFRKLGVPGTQLRPVGENHAHGFFPIGSN